ncbi:MAG TPA: hypothetical protein VMJ32_07870 [Pirellulales bacterium]|nr:hypothetical protein [Pirellulales bacterium]
MTNPGAPGFVMFFLRPYVLPLHLSGFAIGRTGPVIGFFQIAMWLGHERFTPRANLVWLGHKRTVPHSFKLPSSQAHVKRTHAKLKIPCHPKIPTPQKRARANLLAPKIVSGKINALPIANWQARGAAKNPRLLSGVVNM